VPGWSNGPHMAPLLVLVALLLVVLLLVVELPPLPPAPVVPLSYSSSGARNVQPAAEHAHRIAAILEGGNKPKTNVDEGAISVRRLEEPPGAVSAPAGSGADRD